MSPDVQIKVLFQSLHLTEAEYEATQSMLLFRQSREVTDKLDAESPGVGGVVERVGEHYHLGLAQAIMLKTARDSLAFAKVMMTLTNIQTVSSAFLRELFFKETIGNISMDVIVLDVLRSVK